MIVYNTVNMFDRNQTIYIIKDDKTIKTYTGIPLEDVEQTIVKCCYEYNDFSVKLTGLQSYNLLIRDKILAHNELYYDKKYSIEVEII